MLRRQWIIAGIGVACLGLLVVHSTALSGRIGRAEREVAYGGASPHGPADPEVEKGLAAFSVGDYAQVRRIAEGLLARRNRGSTHAEAVDMLVESWLAQGDFARARAAARAHRARVPLAAGEALTRIARQERIYRSELGRYQRQAEAAQQPAEAAMARLRVGHIHRQYGRLDLAEATYRELIAGYPGTEAARRAQRQLESIQAKTRALREQ